MKDKIIPILMNINVPMIAFVSYISKLVLFQATLADSIIVIALTSLFGYTRFLDKRNVLWTRAVEKEISELKLKVQSLGSKQNARSLYEQKEQSSKRRF